MYLPRDIRLAIVPAHTGATKPLIVEGYGGHAPRFAGITVYATQVTTTALHAAKRQALTALVSEG